MKKMILMAAAVMVAVSAGAQDEQPTTVKRNAVGYHHEFFAGTGVCATPNLSAIAEQFTALITYGAFNPIESNLRFKPSAVAGYKYRFEKVVSLGATFSYSGNTADSKLLWRNEGQNKKCYLNRDYYTLATEIEFRYLTREHVTLYSTVGLGVAYGRTVRTAADTGERDILRKTIFTAHISEFGVKVGGRRFGGYLEGGLGYKGVVNLGTYLRF